MTDLERKALLPAGLRDVLPPDAGSEAALVERLMACLAGRGFERVKPPLIEFEDGLLSGAGVAMAPHTFRLMDPVSQRMMGLRADITPQIARIALTRLKDAPRPLRLSYAGDVLRVRGSQLRPERQCVQVGAELIGSAAPTADAEIIAAAASALEALGVGGLSVDLTVPRMVPAICAAASVPDGDMARLRAALDRKDAVAVDAHGGRAADMLKALLAATGTADRSLERLSALDLPAAGAQERARLGEVVALVRHSAPGLSLTIDPVENRGFEYHTGIGFTVFAAGAKGEIGSGGRYRAGNDGAGAPGERATGFTLYVDSIIDVLPADEPPRRLLLPAGTSEQDAQALREAGWITVAALDEVADAEQEARRLGCAHVFSGAKPVPVAEGKD